MTEQHHIYHWRHGWIPLTHAAAMSKAKGNSKLADKFVPGASHHHDAHIATHGMSAAQIHATLAPHKHHSDPAAVAKLRDGDHALVHGMDEHGQPMSFAGTVHGTPTVVRIRQGQNGKVEHHFAVSMHNGSDRSGGDASARTTLYVKNPDQLTAEQAHRDRVIKSMEAYNRPTADQARKAGKVQVRAGTYQGQAGHHVVGTDTKGKSVRIFVPGERRHAEAARDNIKAGRPAFSPPMTDSQRRAAIAATEGAYRNPMNRMTSGTTWRETPKGLIAVRGNREVHLLGTSVNAQKKARQMLADHSFDKLFTTGTKAPGMKNVAFHKLEGESMYDRLDRHKAQNVTAKADLTPGQTVKVAEGTHWHKIGVTGGELVKVGRTQAHVRLPANGVTYQVPLRHVSPVEPAKVKRRR